MPPEQRQQVQGSDCEYAGHDWQPAGGGLEICVVCERERWAEPSGCQMCGAAEGDPCLCHDPQGETP